MYKIVTLFAAVSNNITLEVRVIMSKSGIFSAVFLCTVGGVTGTSTSLGTSIQKEVYV